MDALLRRVLEQREREQELHVVLVPGDLLIHCPRCGTSLQERHGDTLCKPCRRTENERKEQAMGELRGPPCSGCGKPVRSDNTKGHHARCKPGAGGAPPAEKTEKAETTRGGGMDRDVKKRFRAVADALGFDADDILERHMRGWLTRAKDAVKSRAAPEDDFELPSERGE